MVIQEGEAGCPVPSLERKNLSNFTKYNAASDLLVLYKNYAFEFILSPIFCIVFISNLVCWFYQIRCLTCLVPSCVSRASCLTCARFLYALVSHMHRTLPAFVTRASCLVCPRYSRAIFWVFWGENLQQLNIVYLDSILWYYAELYKIYISNLHIYKYIYIYYIYI